MSDFQVGQRVLYALSSGTEAKGEVVKVDHDYVYVKLDDNTTELRNLHLHRIFHLDGRGTGQIWGMPDGCRGSDTGTILQVDVPLFDGWAPTEGRDYPLEPRITYGAFDSYGRMIEPYCEPTAVGFGIENVPQGKRGLVRDTEDNAGLIDQLTLLKGFWKQNCKAVDFDEIVKVNALDILVGLEIYSSWVYTDQFGLQFRVSSRLERQRKRRDMVLDFTQHCMVVGMKTMAEVQEHLTNNAYGRLSFASVENEVITLSDGFQFALLPRYKDNVQPVVQPALETKAILVDNYVMQRLAQDSTPANDLAPTPEAIAA